MRNQDNTPKIRFKGFKESWNVKSYSSIFSFKMTNSYSRDNLNYNGGSVKNIHYGDVHTKFRTMFNLKNEKVPYINNEVNLSKISDDNYCKIGDLIIADASEDYSDIGKCIEIINLNNEKVLAGLHTFLARPSDGHVALGFSGYLMQSNLVRSQIKKIAQGTKVLGISTKRLGEIQLAIPSLLEQQKIASFLVCIDERVQYLNEKRSLLDKYKKGVMQQIFKQEIRFKDEAGTQYPAWQDRKLAEVLYEHKTRNTKNLYCEVFSVAKHKGVINQIEHLGRSYASDNISNYKVVKPNDIIYTKSPTSEFPYGIIKQNKLNRFGVVSVLYAVLSPINEFIGFILDNYFSSSIATYNYLNPLVQKGAKNTMNIGNQDFLNGAKISFPISEDEQKKIRDFLSAIDDKINLVTKQIENTQLYKKGLLQQMFV